MKIGLSHPQTTHFVKQDCLKPLESPKTWLLKYCVRCIANILRMLRTKLHSLHVCYVDYVLKFLSTFRGFLKQTLVGFNFIVNLRNHQCICKRIIWNLLNLHCHGTVFYSDGMLARRWYMLPLSFSLMTTNLISVTKSAISSWWCFLNQASYPRLLLIILLIM